MAQTVFASLAMLPEGWAHDVRLSILDGVIESVTAAALPDATDIRVGTLVPGMPNLHSHAFQRAMAGLTERRGTTTDSFWTWRDMMYRFALTLDPDQMQAVAAMVYVEMLEAGFTRVGEFHYLHHDRDGRPYADPAEMSLRILAAAAETGIHLTHLPVFYAHSDFGGADPTESQRRFTHDLDAFCLLTDRLGGALTRPGDRLGIAPHSLRAVTGEELCSLLAAHPKGPVHIHVAEQVREVEDSISFNGMRPVEYLLNQIGLNERWCLIHATHLTPAECRGIAVSRVVAGLCPVTEANLGDGLFPARDFLTAGGRMGIGTDSNIEISEREELKLLEYGQRLTARQRNVLAETDGSTGDRLFRAALSGGGQALGAPNPGLVIGAPADLVALQDQLGLLPASDHIIDRWIFGTDVRVDDVWVAGQHVVSEGRHVARDTVKRKFAQTMRQLFSL